MPMRDFSIKGYYKVNKKGHYPAPCEPEPNRLYELFADDVLTRLPDGTYVVHTGVMLRGIVLKDNEVTFFPGTVQLVGV